MAQQQNTTGAVFDLGTQNQVIKTNSRAEEQGKQNLKDSTGSDSLRAASDILKNTSAALDTVKELISKETISIVQESGDAELLNKLTEFAEEVVLNPENLAEDMAQQQKGSTIYGDKIWGALKSLTEMTGSAELASAVVDFAKAAADASAKNEILRSLSANFEYLSKELAPSKAVSDELAAAAKALSGPDAAKTFAALKSTLLKLIGYTENSLLLDDNAKNLLPLIVHTISRYNDNPAALKESFDSLLKLAQGITLSQGQLELINGGSGDSLTTTLTKLFDSYIMGNDHLTPEIKQSSLMDSIEAQTQAKLMQMTNLLAAGAERMSERISAPTLSSVLSSVDMEGGTESLRQLLGAVIPDTPAMRQALDSIIDEFEASRNLDVLIDRLSVIVNSIGSDEKKILMAQGLNSVLANLAADKTTVYTRSTSIDTLSDFLAKNINNTFLRSITDMDQGDMLRTLLTAPGVFTPLLHHFVPLDAFGIRAFGELWVDPDARELFEKVSSNDENGTGSHIFLCFEIESRGYYELEIYEKNKSLSVMLLCPESTSEDYVGLRKSIPKIAEQNGYKVTGTVVDTLRTRRNLNEVFPKLGEQRSGFNVSV